MEKLKNALASALTCNVLVRVPFVTMRRSVFNVSSGLMERARFACYVRITSQWVA